MGLFSDYYNNKRSRGINPDDYTFVSSSGNPDDMVPINQMRQTVGYNKTVEEPKEQPKVDTSNAIGSLAQLLGPTPAEREAQQARLERNRQQMAMWTGLFDGLRQLSNLYFTAKGARPQQYSDPYKTIDENYNREVKRLDDLAQYRRAYAKTLYDLQRQAGIEEQNRALNEAKIDWYKNRDDVARMKAENDRLKAVRVIKQKDGSLWKFDPFTGNVEELKESDPLYGEYVRSQINRNNRVGTGSGSGGRGANNGTYGYRTTTYIDEQGRKITERVPTTNGNQPRGQEQPTTRVTRPTRKKTSKKTNEKKSTTTQTTEKRKSQTSL